MLINRTAIFSRCNRYRYQLDRSWTKRTSRKSTVTFIGLNPSTADAESDDPTIRKCTTYAQSWGYNRLIMVNLFAWKTTDPKGLMEPKDPVGTKNDQHITRAVNESSLVLACWGEHGTLLNRADELRSQYPRRLHCLQVNFSGEPTHPLYLPATLTPIKLTKARRELN